ncbi:KH domain-containing protein [Candidatus Nomurabacteria bacterium]|nr:KH domain-containing protein [Candidatus Nomurabacteria bacterium]
MDQAQEFLTMTLKALVDNPDAVNVTRTVDEMGVLMTVDVSPEDMGKVIGRQGATAKSIRTLLRVVGMKEQQRVNMKINEPEGGMRYGQDQASSAPTVEAASAEDVDDAIADLKNEF